MRWNPEAVPPLLRGIGTLLIFVVSVVVIQAERREDRLRADQAITLRQEAEGVAADLPALSADAQLLVREMRLLRLQLGQDDLAEDVFSNHWFQFAGVLGTALIGVSFLLEAWIKQKQGKGVAAPPP